MSTLEVLGVLILLSILDSRGVLLLAHEDRPSNVADPKAISSGKNLISDFD